MDTWAFGIPTPLALAAVATLGYLLGHRRRRRADDIVIESRRELRSRVRAFAHQLGRRHAGRLVAVVAHMGAIRALRPGVLLANTGWCLTAASEIAKLASDAAPAERG